MRRVPALRGAAIGPLRRIVAEGVNAHGVETETLSCGHVLHRRNDHGGPTNAARRRCWKCRKEIAPS